MSPGRGAVVPRQSRSGPLEVTVIVNGEPRNIPAGSTAHDLVVLLGLEGRPLAVEVNEQVVPRARLADCRLAAGDRLELVTLVGGG
jgi:sulfur carrier protein